MNKINIKNFLARIFISNSVVSSRRVLAFTFAVCLIIMGFCHYEIQILKLFAWVILILLGLTTYSSTFGKSGNESQNDVNININNDDKI